MCLTSQQWKKSVSVEHNPEDTSHAQQTERPGSHQYVDARYSVSDTRSPLALCCPAAQLSQHGTYLHKPGFNYPS